MEERGRFGNPEEIEDDLLELIQEAGLTEARMDAFGRNIASAYFNDDPEYLVQKVKSVLAEMEDDKYTMALRFALIGSGQTLAERREETRQQVLSTTDEGASAPSDDTLRRWERRAMRVLSKRLAKDGERIMLEVGTGRDYEHSTSRSGDMAKRLEGLRTLVHQHETEIDELRSAIFYLATMLTEHVDAKNGLHGKSNFRALQRQGGLVHNAILMADSDKYRSGEWDTFGEVNKPADSPSATDV